MSDMLRDGHQRLAIGVVPVRYDLDLEIDPAADFFDGQVEITLSLSAETATLNLHSDRLRIDSATFDSGPGPGPGSASGPRPCAIEIGPQGALTLELETAAPPGQGRLRLRFRGPLEEVPEGLYRVLEGDAWYAFTQFEPLSARRCFPCFDEPGFKAPFRVRLCTPAGTLALANSRCLSTETLPDGRELRTFAETPPLATYLVAFAVGPFDVVSAPDDVCDGVPLRVVTTRGRSHLAGYALERTPRILRALVEWFGQPYPYDKLDLVGVPNFAAGAMENVGLVTFRERLLLLDADRAPAQDRLWAQVVIAHELAHMWFGNLVTMRWWDDLWLNEAFATWMEMSCVAQVDPPLEAMLEAVQEGLRVMDHDALAEARAIRQPILHGGDVFNAFDSITYGKGAAVVRMAESWLGPACFRDGVRQYLLRHAHGNAETGDLMTALGQVSGLPVSETLVTFLDQPGLPLVDVSLDEGPDGALSLHIRQSRHLPDSPTDSSQPGSRWHVPLTVRLGDADGELCRVQHLLTSRDVRLPLGLTRPPTWVHPNADEAGYYRWNVGPALLDALTREGWRHLAATERVGLPEHVWALLQARLLPLSSALSALEVMAADEHRLVLAGVCGALRRLSRLAPGPAWSRWVGRLLGPHIQRIGLLPRAEDTPADRLLRPVLLVAAAESDALPEMLASLAAATAPFFHDLAAADPEVLQYALPIAAARGDAALLALLVSALSDAPTPAHRAAALFGLGAFADPDLATGAFSHFLKPAMRAQDFFGLMRGATRQNGTQFALWAWLDVHYDAVVEKIGDEAAAGLPNLSQGFQDAAGKDTLERFFADVTRRKPGTERNLRQAVEDVERRIRLGARLGGPLSEWLAVNVAL